MLNQIENLGSSSEDQEMASAANVLDSDRPVSNEAMISPKSSRRGVKPVPLQWSRIIDLDGHDQAQH